MKKLNLLRALQAEIRRRDFSTFLSETPSMANGGPEVVVPGCPACGEFLADDVLPPLFRQCVSSVISSAATENP
jgi:hypothetical protein